MLNIIALKSQMHLIGTFMYINENKERLNYPEFNIIFLDDVQNIEHLKKSLHEKTSISFVPNVLKSHGNKIEDVFDKFHLPYLFLEKEKIEDYYVL